jgi:hypothetical protein
MLSQMFETVGVFFSLNKQDWMINNTSELSTFSSFLVFAIEYSWQSTLFEMIHQRDVFLSPLTHSLYSLDKRGGVELGLSFPLQWHYSYRQLVKKFLANTNKLSIPKAQAGYPPAPHKGQLISKGLFFQFSKKRTKKFDFIV